MQTPEGRLLSDLRGRLSIKKAASAVAMSDTRWRQIESGYQTPSAGTRIPVKAPAATLADMVLSLGGQPNDLRFAGRADAAEIAERQLHRRQERVGNHPLRKFTNRELLDEVQRRMRSDEEVMGNAEHPAATNMGSDDPTQKPGFQIVDTPDRSSEVSPQRLATDQ